MTDWIQTWYMLKTVCCLSIFGVWAVMAVIFFLYKLFIERKA